MYSYFNGLEHDSDKHTLQLMPNVDMFEFTPCSLSLSHVKGLVHFLKSFC